MANENQAALRTAATKLANLSVELYNSKTLVRGGAQFADSIVLAASEAGAYIYAITQLTAVDDKRNAAIQAIIKLDQMRFLIETMVSGAFYEEDKAAPLKTYVEKLIDALTKLAA